ncbi:hypothetical protein [Longimicrobium sp.]|jgi:hypothetical protein|uniref:hypothetical protein n=1 Tax=Longimicrobium sp. TaxID=2029185 RepID=UPI002F944D24
MPKGFDLFDLLVLIGLALVTAGVAHVWGWAVGVMVLGVVLFVVGIRGSARGRS